MLFWLVHWLLSPRYRLFKLLAAVILFLASALAFRTAIKFIGDLTDPKSGTFLQWSRGNAVEREALLTVQREACPGAPFILPADGFIGLLYADPRGPYSSSNPHQGIDIFSHDRGRPGLVPVYAAFDGYITREDDWRSTLIQRIPEDPLQPGQQIWLYYTHMADTDGNDFIEDAFPPGIREVFVEQGTLLGYTGNYNGNSSRGVWVHLHFSIVNDDGSGKYTNELDFDNTRDPSPYLGMPVNYNCAPPVPGCSLEPSCS
jgi:murein DD-endopeptidase MepM/ murein hydrolase activator NlpD